MHFAQTLDAGTVPEWKSRYIAYDQGKRLIARLEKANSAQLDAWDLPPPAQDLPEPSRPIETRNNEGRHNAGRPEQPHLTPNRPAPSRPGAQTATTGANLTPRSASRALPRRAVNELSPLLVTPLSRLYLSPKDRSESASGSIPMQPLDSPHDERTAVRKEFYKWLNAEISRANTFYEAMEHESSTKLRLIRVQLDHFQHHRAEHHRERENRRGPTNSASGFMERLDLPTLPAVFAQRNSRNHEPPHFRGLFNNSVGGAHTQDFNNRDDHVGYYQAKAMLRTALAEFYQSLLQLRAFRQMNDTAARKIVKKFDKQLHYKTLDKYLDETRSLPLRSSTVLEQLIRESEYLYADNFTRGNHKLAVDNLNMRAISSRETSESALLISGIFLGAAVPLGVLAIYAALRHRVFHSYETNYLLQMYGGFVLVGLVFLGFGACIALWQHFRINFPFIIELDRSSMINPHAYGLLPGAYLMGLALCAWLTFDTVQEMHRYYPCLFLGLFVLVLAFPAGAYWQTRRWLLHSLWRLVFSGLYAVEFRDLLMGDVMCSLTYSLSMMELFFCVYATPQWWGGHGAIHAQRCTSSHSRALGFLQCLPGIWRFLQCWRRYADTLDWFPHLLNAGKYTFTVLYYMSLSIARISPHSGGLKAMFIVFALINGVYTGLWDVFMDFSLSPNKKLRSVLVYPKWTYYAVMFLDPLMRQNWVLYAIFWNHKGQGAFISFIVALIEAVRRLIWVAFRVENEHAANITRCRAFKDLNLPYDDVAKAAVIREELQQEQDELDRRRLEGDDTSAFPTPSRPEAAHTKKSSDRGNRPTRTSTFPATSSAISSAAASPSLRRKSTFASFSPKVEFAHTNDFQRRKPKTRDEDEDDDDDDDA